MAQDTDWGAILNTILGLAPGVLGGIQGLGGGQSGALGQAERAAGMADPFSSQRGLYQGRLAQTLGQPGGAPNPWTEQLQRLLTDPGSFKTDPGYKFALEEGQNAISRGSNALYGTGRTGSLGPELARYTEGYANQAFGSRLGLLAGLSGQQDTTNSNMINSLLRASGADTGSPSVAADMLMSGYTGQNRGLGAMFSGLGGNAPGGGLGGLLNLLLGRGGSSGGIGGGMGGGSVDPMTGMITYGTGPNASTGYGGQGGWVGEDMGGAPDWGNLFGNWGGSVGDPWYG